MKFAQYAVAALLLLPAVSLAQTAPSIKWNEDVLTWQPPLACADGSPLTDCPITGYRIETATSATATSWSTVTTTPGTILTHKLVGLTSGQHCYRVSALSGAKQGDPSNVACDTAEGPAPGPTRAVTVE